MDVIFAVAELLKLVICETSAYFAYAICAHSTFIMRYICATVFSEKTKYPNHQPIYKIWNDYEAILHDYLQALLLCGNANGAADQQHLRDPDQRTPGRELVLGCWRIFE
jgi:hypothetical protein